MYSQSRGAEVRFDIRMRANRDPRGIDYYNKIAGGPKFEYEDPLDLAFSGEATPAPVAIRKRRRQKDGSMTPAEFRDARGKLGQMWGLGRPLTLTEFGRVLRLGGVRPDQSVRDYERDKTKVSGPLSLAIELLLAGARPPNLDTILDR